MTPVGDAWEKVLGDDPFMAPHDGEGSHPSMLGSYLAACVFHASLTGQGCQGNSFVPAGVSAAAAKTLQQAADATVK